MSLASETAADFISGRLDLFAAPPIKALLNHTAPGGSALLLAVHHVACDAVSLGILYTELNASLTSLLVRRSPPQLPPLQFQYADYSVWQRAKHLRDNSSGSLRVELEWWRTTLADAPTLKLPWRSRTMAHDVRAAMVPIRVEPESATELCALCSSCMASPLCGLLSVWVALLLQICGQSQVVVGQPYSTRHFPGSDLIVGLFINFLPLRLRWLQNLLRQAPTTSVCSAQCADWCGYYSCENSSAD